MASIAEDLQSMAAMHFAIFAAVLLFLLGYLFFSIWRNFHRARLIEDTPTARVRSAAQGYVELHGSAHNLPGSTLQAPLTRSECVWYRYKIEKDNRNNSNSSSTWREIDAQTSEQPFLLDDGTGQCLIDPRGAEVSPGRRKVWYGQSKWPDGAPERGLFGFGGRRYRYTEERLETGDLYAIGWFDTLRSTDIPVQEEVSRRLRDWKQDGEALRQRFDWNRDGRIDTQEWDKARSAAHREVIEDRARRSSGPEINQLRASGRSDQPFLLSAGPQFELASRFRRHAAFALAGFLLVSLVLAWVILQRF